MELSYVYTWLAEGDAGATQLSHMRRFEVLRPQYTGVTARPGFRCSAICCGPVMFGSVS